MSSVALGGMSRTLSGLPHQGGRGRVCLGRAELFTSQEPKQFGARSPSPPLPLSPILSPAVGRIRPSLALPLNQEGLTEVIPRPGVPVYLPPWDLLLPSNPGAFFSWLLISGPEFLRMQSSELHHAFCFVFPVFKALSFCTHFRFHGPSYYCLLFSLVSM